MKIEIRRLILCKDAKQFNDFAMVSYSKYYSDELDPEKEYGQNDFGHFFITKFGQHKLLIIRDDGAETIKIKKKQLKSWLKRLEKIYPVVNFMIPKVVSERGV